MGQVGSMFVTERQGEVLVVTATDELDARNAGLAKEFFRSTVSSGERRIVVDLSPLSFIDSSGLGALLAALKAARQEGGDVRLCGLTPPVRSIFELTRLFRIFDIFSDRSQAVASYS